MIRAAALSAMAVLVVVATLAMPAGATTAARSHPTACEVLRRRAITRVVGTRVRRAEGEQLTPESASVCNWDVGRGHRGGLVSVWVQRGRHARQGFDVSERVFGLGGEPLPRFGSQAFYSGEAGAAYVLDDSEFLYVQRLDPTGSTVASELREQAVELTALALRRL